MSETEARAPETQTTGPRSHRDPLVRAIGGAAAAWWRDLAAPDREGRGPDRAALAHLRRCRSATDAVAVPAFHALRWRVIRALEARGKAIVDDDRFVEGLAAAAVVLAQVRDAASPPVEFAAALGAYRGEDRSADAPKLMAYPRFRRLLQADDDAALIRGMRRAVRLLDNRADPADLGGSLTLWLMPRHGDRIRRAWAFLYFGAEPPDRDGERQSMSGRGPNV